MVDKFRDILQTVVKEKGKVTLFAIMKVDELTDKWSVILCAPWATETNLQEIFGYVKNLLDSKLIPEEKATIARIGIYQKNEYVTQSLLQFTEGTSIKEDTKINGFVIHEAYILASNSSI